MGAQGRSPGRRGLVLARSAWLLLVALAASGCLVADVGLEVGKDGSGKIVIEVYPRDEFRDRLRELDLEDLERLSRSNAAEVDISEIGTVGRRGYRLEVGFDDYRVLNAAGDNGIRLAGIDLRLFTSFVLNEIDGAWTLSAELRPLEEVAALLRQIVGVGPATVDATPEVDLSVTLPGRVIRSNADEQDGGTAKWRFDFAAPVNAANSATRLDMRTEPVPLVTPAQWVIAGSIGVVLVGFVLVVVSSNRAGRSRARRRWGRGKRDGASGWSKEPVDAPKQGQQVVAPPLPWQTYKPGEEPQGTVPPPAVPAPMTASPSSPTAVVPSEVDAPPPVAPPPVAAPPVAAARPPAPADVPSGWYPDPTDQAALRWWDGSAWTDHTRPLG